MKKFLLSAAILTAALTARAETAQVLTVYVDDGTTLIYRLDRQPTVTFADRQMTVNFDGDSNSVAMENVKHWNVEMRDISAIESTNADSAAIVVNGRSLSVNLPADREVRIYGINGEQIAHAYGHSLQFDLNAGIYIISINNKSYKVIIR